MTSKATVSVRIAATCLLAMHIHNLGTATSIYDDRFNPPPAGFSEYRRLATSGRLYEHLMDKTGLSRADVDRAVLAPVFEDPRGDLTIARFNRINSRKQPIRRRR